MYTAEELGALAQAQGWTTKPPESALRMLYEYQQRSGLDPLARQLYLMARKDRKTQRERWSVMTSIDGMRLVAHRAASAKGGMLTQKQPEWAGRDGAWRDVWLAEDEPSAARVTVGIIIPGVGVAETVAVAHMSEYRPGKGWGLWGTMPALMLAKCAEALALRRTCPAELSGLYTSDEMAQADNPPEAAKGDKKLTDSDMRQRLAGVPVDTIRRALQQLGADRVTSLSQEQRQELLGMIK